MVQQTGCAEQDVPDIARTSTSEHVTVLEPVKVVQTVARAILTSNKGIGFSYNIQKTEKLAGLWRGCLSCNSGEFQPEVHDA